MTTVIGQSGFPAEDFHTTPRRLVEDSNGNLITTARGSTTEWPFISTDGGNTWTQGDVSLSYLDALAIDSTDTLYAISSPNHGTEGEIGIRPFTITDTGDVTHELTETVTSSGFGPAAIAVDSTDTVWILGITADMIMGTNYPHAFLYERTGADSYNSHGHAFDTGEFPERRPSIAIDSADDIHLAVSAGVSQDISGTIVYDTKYTRFDGSSFVVLDTNSRDILSPITLDDSDNPFYATGTRVHLLSGGTWSDDAYASSSATLASLSFQNNEIQILWDGGEDIFYNHNTFGSFDTADETIIVGDSTTDDYDKPNIRWAGHHHNPSNDNTMDFVVFDATNNEVEYDQITFETGAVTESGSISASSTPSATEQSTSVSESGSISSDGTPSASETVTTTVRESGSVDAVSTPSLTESGTSVESGSVDSVSTPSSTETGQSTESPSVLSTASLSAIEQDISVNESGTVTSTSTPSSTEQDVSVSESGDIASSSTLSATETTGAGVVESGSITSTSSLSATEQNVSVSESGTISGSGSLSATETTESVASESGSISSVSTLSATEQEIAVSESSSTLGAATLSATETVEAGVAESGSILSTSTTSVTEQNVAVEESGSISSSGTLDVFETVQAPEAQESGNVTASGTPSTTETVVFASVSESASVTAASTPDSTETGLATTSASIASASTPSSIEAGIATESPTTSVVSSLLSIESLTVSESPTVSPVATASLVEASPSTESASVSGVVALDATDTVVTPSPFTVVFSVTGVFDPKKSVEGLFDPSYPVQGTFDNKIPVEGEFDAEHEVEGLYDTTYEVEGQSG